MIKHLCTRHGAKQEKDSVIKPISSRFMFHLYVIRINNNLDIKSKMIEILVSIMN